LRPDLQRLGERHQLSRGARRAHTAARDDHRPLGLLQRFDRDAHACVVRRWAEWRHARELLLDQRLELGLVLIDLTLVAAELQMHRPGRARRGDAERLPHHVGKARHVIDGALNFVTGSKPGTSSTS